MLPLGTPLPVFDLEVVPDTNRQIAFGSDKPNRVSSSQLLTKPLLVMFICAHCPFVKHVEEQITKLQEDYGELVQILAIASNSLITHPQDGPKHLLAQAQKNGWNFPYLLDPNQSFAKALRAACTPDFFIFSPTEEGQQTLHYRGQLDDSRPGNDIPVTGSDLRLALDAVLKGLVVFKDQKPSIGCNIKWHPGEEPHWFC